MNKCAHCISFERAKGYTWKIFLLTRVDIRHKNTRQHYSACSTYKEMNYKMTHSMRPLHMEIKEVLCILDDRRDYSTGNGDSQVKPNLR